MPEKSTFDTTIKEFYKSLGNSIKERKKALKLISREILNDTKRVSKIVGGYYNAHHPNMIGKYEYEPLYALFLCEDKKTFLELKEMAEKKPEKFNEKIHSNYDKMLWGHIDWNVLYKNTIEELSEMDIPTELGKLFDETLVDYVPYATIKYDKLHPRYGRIFIFPEERRDIRKKAIERIYPQHGQDLFKKLFLEKFSGKKLNKFDKYFTEFVKEYLEQKKPNSYSLGLQAYNLMNNISGFTVQWQSLDEVQYKNGSNQEETPLEKLLSEYVINGREQIQKLKEYQQRFDSFGLMKCQ